MSNESKAVFLSYASQDAEAAKRICEALRQAGIEVWFDQSELVGGDAWDAKIRKQIGSCALFVPIISASTQARAEGYFRLEWRLADRRTELMGKSKAFLLPVCIDDTRDADADVPDSFTAVQWTRLKDGETPPKFVEQVKRLLSGEQGARSGETGRPRPAKASAKPAGPHWILYTALALAGLTLAAGAVAWLSRKETAAKPAVTPTVAESISPARDWPKDPELKKAMNLTEGLEAIPDDLALAEEIAKRAVDRSPTDIEAVTVMARVQSHFLRRGFDRSDERAALAKRYAERALQLAPDEPEAMYALATYHFSRGTGEEARIEQLLRRAMELDPTNPRPGRLLADLFNATNRGAEAIAQGQDNIRRFPKDVLSHYDLARSYKDQGRYVEFDRELDATLALAPLPNAIVWKARLQFGLRNDFAGMKTWLDRVPPRVRGTERAVFGYFLYAAFGGDPEAGLGALRDFPQKWFTDFEYAGPTALLNASLLELQGKRELALRQYEVAQGEIQRMRQNDPARIGLSQVEFWTLLGLGRLEEAKASYRRMLEGSRRPYAQDMVNGWWFTVIPGALLIGDRATALTLLRESVENRPESRAAFRLRFQIDPRMAPFRDDPEIVALLAEPKPQTATVAAKLDEKSVAVLAFANLSDDKANEYFSDGISEELLNVLAKVPGLKVSARTSAFFFKGKEVPIPEIARQLGVAYVVEGSVRKAGDKVRITAQLIKAADGFHVWSDTFTRDLKDIFAVQDEIAGLIAQNLQLRMGVAANARTVDAEVLPLYYAALQAWNLRTLEGLERAEVLLNDALSRAPRFARGHAAMAAVWLIRGEIQDTISPFGLRTGSVAQKVSAKLDEALRLDPECAEAYAVRGALSWDTWQWEHALANHRRATELNPNFASAYQWMGRVLASQGRLEEAIASLKRAAELDPLSPRILDNYGRALRFAGRAQEALANAERALALQPGAVQALGLKAEALLQLGQHEAAAEIARGLPTGLPIVSIYKVNVLAVAGRPAELEAMLPDFTPGGHISRIAALTALGRTEEALTELSPDWITATRADMLLFAGVFDPLRGDARFAAALERLGMTEAHARAQAWRAAHPREKAEVKK